jgi:SsrA-binding protein
MRKRRLLLHKAEIRRLTGSVAEKGQTLIPLQLYFKRGIVKVELALAKGKRDYDRRRTIADRDARRDMDRELRSRR